MQVDDDNEQEIQNFNKAYFDTFKLLNEELSIACTDDLEEEFKDEEDFDRDMDATIAVKYKSKINEEEKVHQYPAKSKSFSNFSPSKDAPQLGEDDDKLDHTYFAKFNSMNQINRYYEKQEIENDISEEIDDFLVS